MMLQKRSPYRNQKIRDSARGEPCALEFDGCLSSTETTVWCHSPYGEDGKGMGQKSDDLFGCFGCASCHDILDGRKKSRYGEEEIRDTFHRAMKRSQRRLLDKGILK